jgi:tetratricopeptide (TPR) repeat protein
VKFPRKIQILGWCLALSASLVSGRAMAQVRSEPTAGNQTDRSRELLRQGIAELEAERFESARSLFAQAFELRQTYDVAALLGQAELELARYRDAAEHLDYALRNFPPSESASLHAKLKTGLDTAKKHVSSLSVVVDQPGSAVLLDGAKLGVAPLDRDVFVMPGRHHLEVQLAGRSETRELDLSAGATREVEIELGAQPSAPTPAPHADPPRGPLATNAGSGPSLVPVYIGAALTGIGLATWVGFGIAASNDRDEAENFKNQLGSGGCAGGAASSSECVAAQAAYDSQRAHATWANVGMATTIVAAVGTLGYLLFWPADEPTAAQTRWRTRAEVGRSGASLIVTGSF